MRRTQRSSQRSAESKLTQITSQTQSDSGVVSVADTASVDKVEDGNNHVEKSRVGSKKSTSLVIDVKQLTVNGDSGDTTKIVTPGSDDGPATPPVTVTANDKENKSERLSAKERYDSSIKIIFVLIFQF